MVGTLPPPIQGQPIAFESAFLAIKDSYDCKIVSTSFRSNHIWSSFFRLIKYYLEIPYLLLVFRPNKVYFLSSRSVIGGFRDNYLILLLYFTKVELCNHLHGSNFKIYLSSLPNLYGRFVKFLYRRVDRHAVLVSGMEEQLLDVANPENIRVIPNFYRESRLKITLERREKFGTVNLLFLSSIVKTKGILELIYAVKKLRSMGKDVHLNICGEFLSDEEMTAHELEQQFIELIGQDQSISYLGLVDRETKDEVFLKSDIFVLPTYYSSEAVPLSIIEAMASGCAIITTKFRYLPNIVLPLINGHLVKTRSVADLVKKLLWLIDDDDALAKISKYNMSSARSLYSEKRYRQNIKEFITG
jgi:glycosyltransferase involved in cell wall biosynthesis